MTAKTTLRQMALGLSVLGLAALLLALCLVVSGDVSLAQVGPNPAPEALTSASVSAFPIYDSPAISQALAYIATKQLDDGGIEGWTPGAADEFTTIKAVMALGAARQPVSTMTSGGGNTPLDFLAGQAITYTHDVTGTLFPGRAGMLAVAVVAGDGDAYDFGGMDLIHELTGTYHAATGAYSTTAKAGFSSGAAGTINQVWAILGLAAAQEPVPAGATDFLVGLQEPDGGWGWGSGVGDVDTTSLVVQALLASGNLAPTHQKVQEGLDFLRANQADWGGWEAWGAPSADSTASAVQAIVAAGYTPATESWAASPNPQTGLAGLQAPDGSFGGNALGTAHAIAGLAEAPLPIWGRMQRARLALTWMNEQQ
ncbi:MAG: terpene cyclase/mutase family protein, partial [Anaerolineae bacterium]|nr:terpene cyclase/mutase family protein [Anaerolineae bacterium]